MLEKHQLQRRLLLSESLKISSVLSSQLQQAILLDQTRPGGGVCNYVAQNWDTNVFKQKFLPLSPSLAD